jgi:hypothetical protein
MSQRGAEFQARVLAKRLIVYVSDADVPLRAQTRARP